MGKLEDIRTVRMNAKKRIGLREFDALLVFGLVGDFEGNYETRAGSPLCNHLLRPFLAHEGDTRLPQGLKLGVFPSDDKNCS